MDPSTIKQSLLSTGEEWTPQFENLLKVSPSYLSAYANLRSVPITKQALPRKIQELLLLAIDAQCTHLFQPGIDFHVSAALKAGASEQEVIETLELASVLGVHSVTVGVPLLQEVLAEKGDSIDVTDLSTHQKTLKETFQRNRGYWADTWDPVLKLSPGFFEAYTEYSSVPFQPGHTALEPKIKELVYCAIDCATTHLFGPGLKIHIRNAIEKGATKEEVMEVFELASLMGVHTVLLGADALTRAKGGTE